MAVFLVNRSREATTVRIDVSDLAVGDVREAVTLAEDDRYATNAREQPDSVGLRPMTAAIADGVVSVELPSPGRPSHSPDPPTCQNHKPPGRPEILTSRGRGGDG